VGGAGLKSEGSNGGSGGGGGGATGFYLRAECPPPSPQTISYYGRRCSQAEAVARAARGQRTGATAAALKGSGHIHLLG
jgi:hypothetical protein